MGKIMKLLVLVVFLLMPWAASAQDVVRPAYSQAQLQQMLAPIALYPDALVAQILMASTYPLEVVEATRWVQNPANAALRGEQLAVVLEQEPWDPSVKSLVPFPQVLRTLYNNLEWSEQLGDAFLAQQADVMDAVQRLRQDAVEAGTLTSTPQQTVSTEGQSIVIVPANPEVVYVPSYDPRLVYGDWVYSDYPPYSFPGYTSVGPAVGFAFGVAVVDVFWGWHHWDWRRHRIDIDDDRFRRINRGVLSARPGEWAHDQEHRHSVPYNVAVSPAMAGRPDRDRERRPEFRGYEAPIVHQNIVQPVPAYRPSPVIQRPQEREREVARPSMPSVPVMPQRVMPTVPRTAAPMFESFSHGDEVRRQTERGISSRSAVPSNAGNRGAGRGDGRDDRRYERNQ